MLLKTIDDPVEFQGLKGKYIFYVLFSLVGLFAFCVICFVTLPFMWGLSLVVLSLILYGYCLFHIMKDVKKDYHYFNKKASSKNILFKN